MDWSQAAPARWLLIHPNPVARGLLRSKIERIISGFAEVPNAEVSSSIDVAASLTDAENSVSSNPELQLAIVCIDEPLIDTATRAAVVDDIRRFAGNPNSPEIIVISETSFSVDECQSIVTSGIASLIDARSQEMVDGLLASHIQKSMRNPTPTLCKNPDAAKRKSDGFSPGGMIWQSPLMHTLIEQATRAAQISDVPILILGESGTGKQLLAQYIHSLDPKRNSRPLQSVNCSTISGTLADSMLFGHRKGAFTGAAEARKGIFRAADGGTVLLDEVGELDLALQPKLLHVLQEKVLTPLGSDQSTQCDVRVIAATNRRLPALIQEGKFRLDLYQRLNVIALEIPPLRERREDITLLVDFFLQKYANYYEHPIEGVQPDVYAFFKSCTLEGNVRQLENAIRQTLALKARGRSICMEDIPLRLRAGLNPDGASRSTSTPHQAPVLSQLVDAACKMVDAGSITLPEFVSTCEETALRKSLANSTESSTELADKLGVSRRTLYNKIRKYGLKHPPR